jgi:pullulanase
MVKLAGAVILTSQGIPFLHAGMEFCRTKGGHGNSFNASDMVNQLDWSRKSLYKDVVEYYRKLIHLRKNHPVFRMPTANMIRKNLNFCIEYKIGVVAYCLNGKEAGDTWQQVLVFYNGNREMITVNIPETGFRLIAFDDEINENGMITIESAQVNVAPSSMTLLAR